MKAQYKAIADEDDEYDDGDDGYDDEMSPFLGPSAVSQVDPKSDHDNHSQESHQTTDTKEKIGNEIIIQSLK